MILGDKFILQLWYQRSSWFWRRFLVRFSITELMIKVQWLKLKQNIKNSPFHNICCKFLEKVRCWTSHGCFDDFCRTSGCSDTRHQVLGVGGQILVDLSMGAAQVHQQLGLCVEWRFALWTSLLTQMWSEFTEENKIRMQTKTLIKHEGFKTYFRSSLLKCGDT